MRPVPTRSAPCHNLPAKWISAPPDGLPAPTAVVYSLGMRINEGEVARLAETVTRSLLQQGFVTPKADEAQITARITRLLLDNLRAEEALEQEAEQLAQKLGRQSIGMDMRKITDGIKVRLAKERGFTL